MQAGHYGDDALVSTLDTIVELLGYVDDAFDDLADVMRVKRADLIEGDLAHARGACALVAVVVDQIRVTEEWMTTPVPDE